MEKNREPLLRVEHLKQYFKSANKVNKAVDDVSFEIYKGEVFGLVGESGCGKTTTGRSIIRLYETTGGNVIFRGSRISAGLRAYKLDIAEAREQYSKKVKELKKDNSLSSDELSVALSQAKQERDNIISNARKELKEAKRDNKNCDKNFAKNEVKKVVEEYDRLLSEAKTSEEAARLNSEKAEKVRLAKKARITTGIQMIFQDPIASLDPRMTVHDIIAEGLIIRGYKDKAQIEKMVFEVLELVGLVPEHATRYPHEFSGGQRQRIGIARAIILKPELLIADEPISALDVSIQAQVINLLNELRKKMNLTILFIAHDLSVVKYFSDRIAVMYFGKIVEMAPSEELFAHPLHPYTKSLFSAIPLPDPDYEKTHIRVTYDPRLAHKYDQDKPVLREVVPGHFVHCDEKELISYKEEIDG